MRSFFAAIFFGLFGLLIATSVNTSSAVSIEREFYTQVEQRPAARRHATRTLHRYRPREHSRRASRWSIKRPVRPVGSPPAGFVRSKSGATARVNPRYQPQFQCLVDKLDAAGYRIDFMGGYGSRSFRQSKHPLGLALDVNQTSRNRVTVRLPAKASEMARACGLFHGAQWAHADAGHFEVPGGRVPWPRLIAPPDRQRDLVRVIPLPPVKVVRIPLPPSRPVLAADFAVLDIVPPGTSFNLALLDTEAMPVALTAAVMVEIEYEDPLLEARRYLVATATPGLTMQWQGAGLAIERLHPQFAIRLAAAVREARAAGLERAGIFSAYRPPAFGVGGFSDLFNSLHGYGMAVDMTGVGGPGSSASLQWNRIAAKHKIYGPYGPHHRVEWNHYQPTWTRAITKNEPLRKAITASGPIDLPRMWKIADSLIDRGPHRIFRVGKQKRKYAKRWSKKRWAAFKKTQAAKKKIAPAKKRRYASR